MGIKDSHDKAAILGCVLFGALYLISGVGLITVGIYARLEEGIHFNLKSPVWLGGGIFLGGFITITIACCCGKHSYNKSTILLVVSGAVSLLCCASTLLLEFVEKRVIFQSGRMPLSGEDTNQGLMYSAYVMYLMYLVFSIVGLISAVIGFIYIFCIFIAPAQQKQWPVDDSKLEHQETQTKLTFKPKAPPCDNDAGTALNPAANHTPNNNVPKTAWIYDALSVDSVPAAQPPTSTKSSILNKGFIEELQHHIALVEQQQQFCGGAQCNSSKCKKQPPPESVQGNGERCTALSLERYPFSRKYCNSMLNHIAEDKACQSHNGAACTGDVPNNSVHLQRSRSEGPLKGNRKIDRHIQLMQARLMMSRLSSGRDSFLSNNVPSAEPVETDNNKLHRQPASTHTRQNGHGPNMGKMSSTRL